MDRQRIDAMTTQALATETSRRKVLAGAMAALAAGQLGGSSALAQSGGTGYGASGSKRSLATSLPMTGVEPGNHVQAVVSAHGLATGAGFEVLEQGGTAADAAIAVAAALSVVEPWFSSVLGGGTWALYYDASAGEVTSLDGVGPVGSNASIEDYGERAGQRGMHQANVPGAWDGWMIWLEQYGELDLGQVLAPAIRIARDGYPVSSSMAFWLSQQEDFILEYPDTARVYAPEGDLPSEGETIQQLDMADTFESLVEAYDDAAGESRAAAVQAARDFYYRGPIAEEIVAFSDEYDGYLTLDDFNSFETEIVDAISINYNDDVTVFQNPPNSQGITQLLALNILKDAGLSELGPDDPDAVHLQVEAIKLAFTDRHHYVGDPDRVEVPVSELLSDEYAAEQRERIDMNAAMEWPIEGMLDRPAPAHTTTYHVVDGDGNGAAVTTSLGANFLVIGDTGIHINNRMRMISLEEGNPNQLTPGYKVRHTSNPYLALRDNRPYILGGVTGADTQPQAQVQQFVNVVEFGMNAQEAIDRPRFVSTSFPGGTYPHDVGTELYMEEGFPDSVVAELEARGHQVVVGQGTFGSGNMLVLDQTGTDAQAGAESRSDTATGQVIPAES